MTQFRVMVLARFRALARHRPCPAPSSASRWFSRRDGFELAPRREPGRCSRDGRAARPCAHAPRVAWLRRARPRQGAAGLAINARPSAGIPAYRSCVHLRADTDKQSCCYPFEQRPGCKPRLRAGGSRSGRESASGCILPATSARGGLILAIVACNRPSQRGRMRSGAVVCWGHFSLTIAARDSVNGFAGTAPPSVRTADTAARFKPAAGTSSSRAAPRSRMTPHGTKTPSRSSRARSKGRRSCSLESEHRRRVE